MKTDIYNNMNENGGGLAVNITGKYESNRKALADMDGNKRTAGEVAQSLRKKGYSIKANDIKSICEEWHHAGFIPASAGGGMARTFYTRKSDDEILSEIEESRKTEEKARNTIVTGFYYIWDHDYSGYRGKKRNYKMLKWYEGTELNQPRNFTICDRKFYLSHKHIQASYYGWDEPTIMDIKSKNCDLIKS